MKTHFSRLRAFTLVELLIIVAVLGLLATLLVQAQADPDARARRERLVCVNNLKQIGLALRMWSNDHSENFPMQYSADKKGSREAIEADESWRHFQTLSNELSNPRVLACPTDDRPRATAFADLSFMNVSYFVGLDANESLPQMLLAGDRNVTNGLAPKNGVLELTGSPPAGWTEAMHNESGNLGLADGSVKQVSTPGLRQQIAAANLSNKIGKTRLQFPQPAHKR